jgi:hypothetical protein
MTHLKTVLGIALTAVTFAATAPTAHAYAIKSGGGAKWEPCAGC